MDKPLLTRRQLARLLQVGEGQIRKLTDAGAIPFVVVGTSARSHRFDPEAVVDALRRDTRLIADVEEANR